MFSSISVPKNSTQLKTQSLAALPIPISSSPNLNQQDVALNSSIRIVFDKPFLPANGHFIITNGKGDTRSISALDGNQVFFSNDQTNTLVILPLKSLLPGNQYSVQMEQGALTDTDGNPLAGVTNSNALNFSTQPVDTAPPVPVSTRPSDNAEQVDIDSLRPINIEFNEPIKAGSGNITISNGRGDTHTFAITDTSQVSIGFSSENHTGEISILPAMKLLSSSTYSVQIDKGAITDLAGNAFAGVYDTTSFNFSTASDTLAPQLSTDNPIVSLSPGSITLNFNEPVFLVSGSIGLSDSQGNSRLIAVNDQHQVSAAIGESKGAPSTSITLSPKGELVAGSQYIVNLENSVITDVAGNKLAGAAPNALKVTTASPPDNNTPDISGPNVVSVTPANNQADVAVASNFIVQFNEAILPSNGNFILSNGQGDTRVISASDKSQVDHAFYSSKSAQDSTTLIINPAQNLLANSHYFLQMETGAVSDLAGNLVKASVLDFTTSADTTAPIPLSSSPANTAQQVSLDSKITGLFNEPITAGDGNITIVDTQNKTSIIISAKDTSQVTFDGAEITVRPKQNFEANHQYSVLLDANAISDYAGNFFPAVSDPNVLTFATNDKTAPKFIGYSNQDISRDGLVPINSSFTLRFNEALKLGKGNITLADNHGGSRIININDPDQVYLNYDSVAIKPKQFLNFNDHYSVLIDAGVVTDLAGNAYAGLNDSTSITFDTRAPNPPPKLSSFQLVNTRLTEIGSIDSGAAHLVNSDIALRFDTTFKLGVGHVIISDGHNDTRSIDINDASQVTVISNKAGPSEIRINPATDLLSNSHYFIQLEAGSITDLVGTPIAAITDTNTIAFDTAGLVPAPAAMHPVQEINHGGVEGIYDNHDVLQLNFNQPVNWKFGGFSLSQHDLGGNDIYLSADGRSATVELNNASTIAHGDILTLTGISDQWGHIVDVAFTL